MIDDEGIKQEMQKIRDKTHSDFYFVEGINVFHTNQGYE